jgi:glutaredoxin
MLDIATTDSGGSPVRLGRPLVEPLPGLGYTPVMRRVLPLILIGLLGCPVFTGCSKKDTDRPAPEKSAQAKTLSPISVTRQRSLVFTYRQGGEFRTVTSMDQIPLGARGWVRVQDPQVRNVGSGQVYVADLRQANDKGAFPYQILTRQQFLKGSPLPGGGKAGMGMAAVVVVGKVVLYSRPGCGACDAVRAYLNRRGVQFEEKNIQADAGAAKELKAKAAQKGFPAGAVPVIDINGEIVVGFNVRKLESLLRRRV